MIVVHNMVNIAAVLTSFQLSAHICAHAHILHYTNTHTHIHICTHTETHTKCKHILQHIQTYTTTHTNIHYNTYKHTLQHIQTYTTTHTDIHYTPANKYHRLMLHIWSVPLVLCLVVPPNIWHNNATLLPQQLAHSSSA